MPVTRLRKRITDLRRTLDRIRKNGHPLKNLQVKMTRIDVIPTIKGFPMDVATMLRSRDLGVAEKTVSNIIDPRRFRFPGSKKPSNIKISHVAMTVGHLFGVRHGVPVQVTSDPITSYQVMVPMRGRLTFDQEVDPGAALIYAPNDVMNTFWSADCLALVLSLPENNFRRFLCEVYPDRDWTRLPKPASRVALTSGSGRSFANLLGTICHECLDSDSAFLRGINTRPLEESLLLSLLLLLCNDVLPDRATLPRRPAVERARDYIDANCQDEISAADLVQAAGTSPRSLQLGFIQQFGVGPMTYLKQTRLRRVHDALRAARPGCDSVGDIAARWGFFNGSAFAKTYKSFFGQLPSETLAGN